MKDNIYEHGFTHWYITVSKDISIDGEIYLIADRVEETKAGSLIFYKETIGKTDDTVNLILATGTWFTCYRVDENGHPLAIEEWNQ